MEDRVNDLNRRVCEAHNPLLKNNELVFTLFSCGEIQRQLGGERFGLPRNGLSSVQTDIPGAKWYVLGNTTEEFFYRGHQRVRVCPPEMKPGRSLLFRFVESAADGSTYAMLTLEQCKAFRKEMEDMISGWRDEDVADINARVIAAHRAHYVASSTGLIRPKESPNGNTIYHLYRTGEITSQKGGDAYLQRHEFNSKFGFALAKELGFRFVEDDMYTVINGEYAVLTEEECETFRAEMSRLIL
jgi:hypothetical protein